MVISMSSEVLDAVFRVNPCPEYVQSGNGSEVTIWITLASHGISLQGVTPSKIASTGS